MKNSILLFFSFLSVTVFAYYVQRIAAENTELQLLAMVLLTIFSVFTLMFAGSLATQALAKANKKRG